MKYIKIKSISGLVLVLTFLMNTTTLLSQEVTVNIQHPPYNQLKIEDMWRITLINTSSTTLTVNLKGTLTEAQAGLIATGESRIFELPPGRKIFTGANYKELDPDINYVNKDPRYQESVTRTGGLPSGEYEICVYMKETVNNQTIAVDCKQQVVESFSSVTLVNPEDRTVVQTKQISFTWLPVISGLGPQTTYMVKVVEILNNQSSQDAMNNNPAFFESGEITGTTFIYPPSANELRIGKNYCWKVSAFVNSVNVSESDIWTFDYQTRSITPAFDCSFISYTPLALTANIKSKQGSQQLVDLLPESFGATKVFFSCVDGNLYADGLDNNLQPYKIKGEIVDTTARTAFGKRGMNFSLEGNFNLSEEFSTVKMNFAGFVSEEGMTGSFEGTAIAASVSLTDTIRFEGNFAAHFISELKFNYFIYPYISIFKTGTISYEYSKKLDDYFDTCIKGAIDKDKKEEVLKKCDISVNKFMCFGAVARTSPPYLTNPDIDIYLSGTVCTISATSLLDEYIHAAGFVAKLGTSEEADHLFRDYVIELIGMCVLSNSGSTNKMLIDASKKRIEALLSNKDLSDNLEKFKKATGISLSHK